MSGLTLNGTGLSLVAQTVPAPAVRVGLTEIQNGTSGRLLYDNGGLLGETAGWTTSNGSILTGAAGTSIAINGATIGGHALAITGSANISGDIGGPTTIGLSTNARVRFRDSAGTNGFNADLNGTGILLLQNIAGTTGITLNFSSADGILTLQNATRTDFTLLRFGGITSSFPALKRSATALETKLADDSAYAQHNQLIAALVDGITAPSATVGLAKIFVDTADGDLKVLFGDGTVKTLATDT